jgi:hypothetical protein
MEIGKVWISDITPNTIQFGNSYNATHDEEQYKQASGKVMTLQGMAFFWTCWNPRYKGPKGYTSIDITANGQWFSISLPVFLHSSRSAAITVRKAVKQVLEAANEL